MFLEHSSRSEFRAGPVYTREGAVERDVCAHGIPHTYIFSNFFRGDNPTNQSAKADLEISSLEGC